MFARQSTILLEWACRLCDHGPGKSMMGRLSSELQKIEQKYFITLPGTCKPPGEFDLPRMNSEPGTDLLSILYDSTRNGQAHQYQQIPVELEDNKFIIFTLTGAEHTLELNHAKNHGRSQDHLSLRRIGGNLALTPIFADLITVTRT